MSILEDTDRILAEAQEKSDSIIVAYSGGKDSLVVMDLCCRRFKTVKAFFMYLIPGLDCIQVQMDYARQRWGIEVAQYPHWMLYKFIQQEIFCAPWHGLQDLPEYKLEDVYALALKDLNCPTIAVGAKLADSAWRRRFMVAFQRDFLVNPIKHWLKWDVLAYLKHHNIPLPKSVGNTISGISLDPPTLLWLHDVFPQDFERLLKIFPFAEAVIARRKFYSLGDTYQRAATA